MDKKKILVLDGQNKNSLAVARSLFDKHFFIGVASSSPFSVTFLSRKVNKRHILHNV